MKDVIDEFNDCITSKNIHGLSRMVSDQHKFIDKNGMLIEGKSAVLEAWARFFDQFPDYENIFEEFVEKGNQIVLFGKSQCSTASLNGRAIWLATIENKKITRWQVFEDNEATRAALNI